MVKVNGAELDIAGKTVEEYPEIHELLLHSSPNDLVYPLNVLSNRIVKTVKKVWFRIFTYKEDYECGWSSTGRRMHCLFPTFGIYGNEFILSSSGLYSS